MALAHTTLRDGVALINVYTRNVPVISDDDTEATVVARYERNTVAELSARGLQASTHQVVFALDLLQIERLCATVPDTEPGVAWLRRLIAHGFRFVWGPEYIRLAREDEPGEDRYRRHGHRHGPDSNCPNARRVKQ